MELIIDFMLLAASGAAVFYCVILSRKLEGLKNTEKGLGATIASMSQTVDQAHSTVVLAKESSNQSVKELTPLIDEMRTIMPKVTEMIDALGELGEVARQNITTAAEGASQDIEESLGHARAVQIEISERIFELNELLNGHGAVASEPTAPTEQAEEPESESPGEVAYIEDIEPLDRRMVSCSAEALETNIDGDEKIEAAG